MPDGAENTLKDLPRTDNGEQELPPPNSIPIPREAQRFYTNHPQMKDIPPHAIRHAWFTMAHMLLPAGSKIAVMGCSKGHVPYAMAVMHPEMQFVGVDSDRKAITQARKLPALSNLKFQTGDLTRDAGFGPKSLDAIINSFTLHEIYSNAYYNERQVARALDYQFTLLKTDGILYIRDYALRFPGEYVLMEMPDEPSRGEDIKDMSETDLLLWYSERARSREDPGCHGFFLEELPPRFPRTRMFRLPYKWAYEFIIRKDRREDFREELHKEFTFYTERDFRKAVRGLGVRPLYASPHWDDSIIGKYFEGRFRLYDDNGKSLGPPPTSFIIVAQKVDERKSISLKERRPSQKAPHKLQITTMRNERTGKFVDIVTRDVDITEIIPYRVTADNKLHIFIHELLPRGIVNAVPRNGKDIDGKRWSGHMVEAIGVPSDIIHGLEHAENKETLKFAQKYLGLKAEHDTTLENGRAYYPAPDYIDELIKTKYLRVQEQNEAIEPRTVLDEIRGFTTFGKIREVDAQDVLNAISVGFVPNARLELQIMELYECLGIEMETWSESPLTLEESDPEIIFDGKQFMKMRAENDSRFKKARGSAGQIRTVQSIFVDEGWVEGGISGMASRDMEFIISEESTINRASVIPLTKKAGEVMAGFEVDYLPVPQRHEGNGLMMKAPVIDLPKDVTNIYQAKKYVAEMFKVPVENVWRLGEAYFSHTGITPQRIFPFAVATKGQKESPLGGMVSYAPLLYVMWLYGYRDDFKQDTFLPQKLKKAFYRLAYDNDQFMNLDAGMRMRAINTDPKILQVSNIQGLSSSTPRQQPKQDKPDAPVQIQARAQETAEAGAGEDVAVALTETSIDTGQKPASSFSTSSSGTTAAQPTTDADDSDSSSSSSSGSGDTRKQKPAPVKTAANMGGGGGGGGRKRETSSASSRESGSAPTALAALQAAANKKTSAPKGDKDDDSDSSSSSGSSDTRKQKPAPAKAAANMGGGGGGGGGSRKQDTSSDYSSESSTPAAPTGLAALQAAINKKINPPKPVRDEESEDDKPGPDDARNKKLRMK